MKKLRYFCLIFILLPMCFLLVGCGKPTVTNIQKTGENGNVDIYTIYYSNGTTSTISIKNGQDGTNGEDLNLKELYDLCIKNNLYSGDFQSFLQDYVNNNANDNAGIYAAMNSVVSVYSAFQLENYSRTAYEIGAGAGVIYSMDRASNVSYVLTNCHVVTEYYSALAYKLPETIMVWQYGANVDIRGTKHNLNSNYYADYSFSGGVNAKCVGYSADYDLAILQLETDDLLAFNENACAVSLAEDYSLAEKIFAIGNPEAEGISVTSGIISVVSEEISIAGFPVDNLAHTFRVLRMDAAIYGGNSGGGVFNAYGKLVGIANASLNEADNYNFALPIDNVKQVANNLIYYAQRGTRTYNLKRLTMLELGATLGENFEKYDNSTGKLFYNVAVESLKTSSLLKNCGLQQGDVIESVIIDDVSYNITRAFQLDDLLISAKANSSVTFNVLRGGTNEVVNLLNFEQYI